jgi:hypothetical protein
VDVSKELAKPVSRNEPFRFGWSFHGFAFYHDDEVLHRLTLLHQGAPSPTSEVVLYCTTRWMAEESSVGQPACSLAFQSSCYLPAMFLGDFLFRVARSKCAEAGGGIALLITMSFAVTPFP